MLPDELPWRPFASQIDFEMAEFVLEAGLDNGMTDRLISLITWCISGEEMFPIKDHRQLSKY